MDRRDGKVPSGWALTDVASVGEVRLGRQRSPDKLTGRSPCKYLRAANITPDGISVEEVLEMDFTAAERQVFLLRAGDVLLAEASGSPAQVGRAAIWQNQIAECCYQNTIIRFRPRLVSPEYAMLVFRHYAMSGKFAEIARGVGIQHLGATRFASMTFPLPPLAEQRRISAELNRRTDEIRQARRSLTTTLGNIAEQTKQILAAAVTGELVESEAVLADRDQRAFESGHALLMRLANDEASQSTIFDADSSKRHDTDAYKLPVGWAQARIDEVGALSLGKARSPQHQHGAYMHPYLRVANVYEDRIDVTHLLTMNFPPTEYDKYSLRYGDILLNDGQSPELVGRPAIYRGEAPGACFQNHLIRFRAGDAITPEFALLVFRHYLHSGIFKAAARWTTNIATLSLGRFSALPFPIPPLTEQARIVEEARRRLDASSAQQASVNAALERLPGMEAELLAAAIEGALVPQDEGDEPASQLLTGDEPIQVELPYDEAYVSEELHFEMPTEPSLKSSEPSLDSSEVTLGATIRAAGHPLRVPELFRMAGYDRDSTEDVERFYLALRSELGRSVRRVGEEPENDLLEAITVATE